MFRAHTRPRPSIVLLPFVRVQRYIPMTHDHLAKQINAVVKVLLLVRKWVRIVVVVGVVGFANFVHAVQCVKDIQSREVAALVVI
ncbi:hypothetical protein VFPPC_16850 [Pochonia chlamydosporia 170]|uniref:Uncharacterized protein n=1 Tax=Pochonia chlamydosporia 170 TaxID=1380566 RepID=A0A179F2N0_METCM|nr:hypothetical protein VFPPC_16850 [Pochonia chlamydosporia 170]OAQ59695.1 hypothetical protein VFPPC_16850 [Pochonia chlamydosporia 170]